MFLCDKCGCCCRKVGTSPIGKYLALENGICKYLDTATNLCTIYNERPIFCNVDKYYELFLANQMTKDVFFNLNKQICKELQKNNGKQI